MVIVLRWAVKENYYNANILINYFIDFLKEVY